MAGSWAGRWCFWCCWLPALITQAPLAVFLLAFVLVLLVLLRLDAAYLRRQVTAELAGAGQTRDTGRRFYP